jgi:hypothetical protein
MLGGLIVNPPGRGVQAAAVSPRPFDLSFQFRQLLVLCRFDSWLFSCEQTQAFCKSTLEAHQRTFNAYSSHLIARSSSKTGLQIVNDAYS